MSENYGSSALLTAEDSKRVADAIIERVESEDISGAVSSKLHDLFWPADLGSDSLRRDWFARIVEHMCDQIKRGVVGAAQDAAEKLK